jgi:uncharacterized protein with PQ loop repeat
MAVGGPVMTIPQIITIITTKCADGVSIVTWGSYVVLALMWLRYGYEQKDNALILNSVMNTITTTSVVILTLIY